MRVAMVEDAIAGSPPPLRAIPSGIHRRPILSQSARPGATLNVIMTAPSAKHAISDYGVIGDCRSAALISRSGSLDWLCWPDFDSPSLFAALLDEERGGHFRVAPRGEVRDVRRRYVGDSAVLETDFRTDTGVARLTDFMPVASVEERRRLLAPDCHVLRVLDGLDGEVEFEIDCRARPDFARVTPRLIDRGALGFYFEHGGGVTILRGDMPLECSREQTAVRGRVCVRAGERRAVALAHGNRDIAVIPALGTTVDLRLRQSLAWWNGWASRCSYEGRWKASVMRSALTLKLMCFAPSGAVVAAPTTSLPETRGGTRNWDYRYCWVRDASLTLQALFDLGFVQEAAAFVSWLLHTTKITRPALQILYNVYGGAHLHERELPHLRGFDGARPVRVGNAAYTQLQLDVYGEVIDAVYEFQSRGGELDAASRAMLRAWGSMVTRHWTEPDEGIWEVRAGRRHHTHSKVMCWLALTRLLQLADAGELKIDVDHYRTVQRAIREEVDARGYNTDLHSYVSELGGAEVDASLLLLARFGYEDAASERMAGTYRLIEDRLSRNGVLYRYCFPDGLPPGDGAFGICSFWQVDYLARAGRLAEAERLFERLLGFANDLGLYGEEIDPDDGEALGNFPQAFTHVGLIDAALTIEERRGGRSRGSPQPGTRTIQ